MIKLCLQWASIRVCFRRAHKCVKWKTFSNAGRKTCEGLSEDILQDFAKQDVSHFHFIKKQRKEKKAKRSSRKRRAKVFIFNLRENFFSPFALTRLSLPRKANENYEHFSSCEETFYYAFLLICQTTRRRKKKMRWGGKMTRTQAPRSFKRYKLKSLLHLSLSRFSFYENVLEIDCLAFSRSQALVRISCLLSFSPSRKGCSQPRRKMSHLTIQNFILWKSWTEGGKDSLMFVVKVNSQHKHQQARCCAWAYRCRGWPDQEGTEVASLNAWRVFERDLVGRTVRNRIRVGQYWISWEGRERTSVRGCCHWTFWRLPSHR